MTTSHLSTKNLQEKRRKYVSRAVSNGNLNIASHASGSTIIDRVGNGWIEFAGAIGVLNVGHTHPKVTRAVKEQVGKFLHPGFNVMMYEGYINLPDILCRVTMQHTPIIHYADYTNPQHSYLLLKDTHREMAHGGRAAIDNAGKNPSHLKASTLSTTRASIAA